MEIQYLYNHVFSKTFPDDVSIQRIGKKRNDQQMRPILIKFRYIKDLYLYILKIFIFIFIVYMTIKINVKDITI